MKNCILISVLLLLSLGCKQSSNNLNELVEENKKLIKEVETLKDSLSDFEENFLHSQILMGISDNPILKVGEKNNIVVCFQTINKKLPEYEIYKIDGNKKIKIGTDTKTRFNYNFTPKSIHDNKLKLLVKMQFKGRPIEIPAEMLFVIKH